MSKFKQHEPIETIMTKNPKTITRETKLSEVGALFAEGFYHHLPVVKGDHLEGMVTYTDFMRVWFGDTFNQDQREVNAILDSTKSVDDIMTHELKTLTMDSSVKDAANDLKTSALHAMPVVNGDNHLIGIVTSKDIIEYLCGLY